jgi:uncharacterized protein YhbP (UPF0306 family)
MKRAQNLLKLVAAFLNEQTTLSLATTGRGGEVWVAPLYYLPGKDLSLYWLSSESSLHSMNLKITPNVAATVYRDARSWRQIRGVQMRGLAARVEDPALRAELIDAYCKRFKLGQVLRIAARQSILYALYPEFFRYIDNAKGLGCKFELTRTSEIWRPARS